MAPSIQDYIGGDMFQAAINDLAAAAGGESMLGLFVGGSVFMTMYVASKGDLRIATVVTLLAGGLLFPTLPAGYGEIGSTVLFLGMAAAVLSVLKRYVIDAGGGY